MESRRILQLELISIQHGVCIDKGKAGTSDLTSASTAFCDGLWCRLPNIQILPIWG